MIRFTSRTFVFLVKYFWFASAKVRKKTGKETMLQPAFYRKRLRKYQNYTIGKS